jgi:hypothetical protein
LWVVQKVADVFADPPSRAEKPRPRRNPCSRRSPPGLLARRLFTFLTLSLIAKESNRLDETIASLMGSLDDTLASYT